MVKKQKDLQAIRKFMNSKLIKTPQKPTLYVYRFVLHGVDCTIAYAEAYIKIILAIDDLRKEKQYSRDNELDIEDFFILAENFVFEFFKENKLYLTVYPRQFIEKSLQFYISVAYRYFQNENATTITHNNKTYSFDKRLGRFSEKQWFNHFKRTQPIGENSFVEALVAFNDYVFKLNSEVAKDTKLTGFYSARNFHEKYVESDWIFVNAINDEIIIETVEPQYEEI